MRRFQVDVEGGQLAGVAYGDPVRPVDSLFLHANGFNAMTYQSILAPLGHRAHVAGIDLRGHGRSTAPAIPAKLHSWNQYRDDVIAAIKQLSPEGTVLAGHSMGATIALLAAGREPDLVTGLILVDPVLLSPGVYRGAHMPGVTRWMKSNSPMSKGALKRRSQFDSHEQAVDSLRGKGAFKTWREPFLEDYITDGLAKPDPNDVWQLACTPEWEAANFGAQRNRPWGALRKVECPIVLITGEKGSTCPPSSVERVTKIKSFTVTIQPTGTSHFVPMERPYVVRDRISEFLAQYVEGFEMGDEGRVQRNLDSAIGQKD